jgi:6-phosphogluconolactonase (cycloisomerase 2 family)
MSSSIRTVAYLAATALTLGACNDDGVAPDGSGYAGFVYTSTNNSAGNAIVAMGRSGEGSLVELPNSPFATGGSGDAAEGDFDTQWALRMVGDYLLAVNAGGNPTNSSISVFRVNRENGSLAQIDQDPATSAMDNMDSRGIRAASIAASVSGGTTYVLVANQHSNPNFQMSPAQAFGTVQASPLRNLAVFTLDPTSGVLQFSRIGATYESGENGGPTTVEFDPSGTRVAVSTWGVTHFMVPDPDLALQRPGRLYLYDFASGGLSETGVFEEAGISGNIGLSWSPTGRYVYLSNFNLHSSKEANSLTVHDGTTGAKVQNFATGGRNDEGCWTWVSLDKRKLYVASFGENVVSVFDIGADDQISTSLTPNFVARGGGIPTGDTKDMYEAPGGHLYVLGAFQSHTVSVFDKAANGALTERAGSPYRIPSSVGKTKEQHAFLGLTGFER